MVLRGGMSDEYHVSMQTGANMLKALKVSPYTVEDIIVSKSGDWLQNGIAREPEHILQVADVAVLAFHGSYGEDGTVQRILDRYGVPYTGSKPYPSSIAMNKMLAKEHLQDTGIKLAPHMRVSRESSSSVSRIAHTIFNLFGPEYVVKPISGGSSIGTLMAKGPIELASTLESSLKTYDDLLVEQRIRGREATCGVVENFRNKKVYSLPVIEIVPPAKSDFFEASVKYTGETEEICPGRFKKEEKAELERIAQNVHETLGLSQYSRSDFMVAEDGIYFLEVNTLPGLTEESLLPKSLAAVGCEYRHFLEHLITLATTRESSV